MLRLSIRRSANLVRIFIGDEGIHRPPNRSIFLRGKQGSTDRQFDRNFERGRKESMDRRFGTNFSTDSRISPNFKKGMHGRLNWSEFLKRDVGIDDRRFSPNYKKGIQGRPNRSKF